MKCTRPVNILLRHKDISPHWLIEKHDTHVEWSLRRLSTWEQEGVVRRLPAPESASLSLNDEKRLRVGRTDTQTGMLPGVPGSATCVQKHKDSRDSAIHF